MGLVRYAWEFSFLKKVLSGLKSMTHGKPPRLKSYILADMVNPLSSNIQIQILQTDLHGFP